MTSRTYRYDLFYGAAILGFTLIVLSTQVIPALWYVMMPSLSVVLICFLGIKTDFSPKQFIVDVRNHRKELAIITGLQAVMYAFLYGFLCPPEYVNGNVTISLSMVTLASNVVEELLFRVVGIPIFELLENRLYGMANQKRVVFSTSIAFALAHLMAVIKAPPPSLRLFEILRLAWVFYVGIVLGNIYFRSRNAASVILLHWLISLLSQILKAAVLVAVIGIR
ncbi:MAG: CPBP family intramembrane glutamic endopeptidase [Bacillota bacterium]|jgi:membrane protease YdiL (CAAX protease family)